MATDERAPKLATFNLGGLHLPWKTIVVIVVSTTLLLVDYYYRLWEYLPDHPLLGDTTRRVAVEHFGIYFVIPVLTILIMREKPADYGFQLGNWRAGIKWVLIIWAIAAPILYFAGSTPEMAEYYRRFYSQPALYVAITSAMELFSWEFFFRGFLIFALLRVAGPSAVVLQAVPFALAHVGKPPLETFSTIFGGTMFGWVAWRTGSFVYSWAIHWFIMTFTIIVALSV
jgi:membrane protease YdiL (CAAX protease family)